MLSATCHLSTATFRHRASCSEAIAAQRASALEGKMVCTDPKPRYTQKEAGFFILWPRARHVGKDMVFKAAIRKKL